MQSQCFRHHLLRVRYHWSVFPKDAARNKKSAQLQRLGRFLLCFHDEEVHRSRIPIMSEGSGCGAGDYLDHGVRKGFMEADQTNLVNIKGNSFGLVWPRTRRRRGPAGGRADG